MAITEHLALLRRLLTEFFGTFFLCFTIASAAGQGAALTAVGIGCTLMVAIFAGGHLSGAHYNPAVSFGLLIRGKLTPVEFVMYVAAQICGAFSGGGSAMVFEPAMASGTIGSPAVGSGVGVGSAFLAEVIITFALVHTVLNVATTTAQANNNYYGLAIGFTVLSGAISVGGVSGGAFNPAVAMLSVLVDDRTVANDIWIWIVGPLVGGGLAAAFFRLTQPAECDGKPGSYMYELRVLAAPYLVEFVGTFLLAYTVALAAAPSNTSGLAPLSIGSMLLSQVFAGGATSGAHYNPAVTLGVLMRRELAAWSSGPACQAIKDTFDKQKAVCYILVQSVAAIGAGGMARATLAHTDLIGFPSPKSGLEVGRAWWAEFVATFLLVTVVLQVAVSAKTAGNSFFGLAIGYTVAAMAVAVGGVSGGAFNPAVGLLGWVAFWNTSHDVHEGLWIYWVAPPLAGCVAGLFFRVTNYEEFASTEVCAANPEKFEVKFQHHSTVDLERQSLHAHHPPVSAAATATWKKATSAFASSVLHAAQSAGLAKDGAKAAEMEPIRPMEQDSV